jgi:hypothetical protein
MEAIDTIALMLGAAWASGINLYAAIFVLGWLGGSGQVALPPDLQLLSHPAVMVAAGAMYMVEFFADKVPGFDTAWDAVHTFIRVPGGALLAAGAAQGLDLGPSAELVGLLVGGGLAAGTHAAKTGTRAVINTSPEPVSNWSASLAEDAAVIGGLWTAFNHPWVFLGLLLAFVLAIAWLLPRLWRALRQAFRGLRRWLGAGGVDETDDRPQAGRALADTVTARQHKETT